MRLKHALSTAAILLLLGAGVLLLSGWMNLLRLDDHEVVHEAESPYQPVFVTELAGIRYLHVGSLRHRSSALDPDDPLRHVYGYTALMMLSLGYVDQPRDVLMVGLGGGTMPRWLRAHYPEARIVNVEFDPEVVRIAKEYFDFVPDENMEVVIKDARRWLRTTDQRFDLILLDAFHGGYIPFHLTTREFLIMVREHLKPGGAVCANTWVSQSLAERESATYQAVFDGFHHYLGGHTANRIIVARPDGLPGTAELKERLAAVQRERALRGVDLVELHDDHRDEDPHWSEDARVLTDDHAPVNLLVERP
jgi:spermidine synthase